jgi:CDP-diacylglycerol pyrophosphatase
MTISITDKPTMSRIPWASAAAAVAVVAIGLGLLWSPVRVSMGMTAASVSSNSLWLVERYVCLPNMRLSANPKPCEAVNAQGRYAIFSVPKGDTEVLLIPLDKIDGIEDARLLGNKFRNYWNAAWSARSFVQARLGRPIAHEAMGMAVNSQYARTQNQLHIHVDCIKDDVRAALDARKGAMTRSWSDFSDTLAGHRYRVIRIDQLDGAQSDPFRLAIDDARRSNIDLRRLTIAVVGMRFEDGHQGFAVLSGRADPALGLGRDNGSTEGLLDHYCRSA